MTSKSTIRFIFPAFLFLIAQAVSSLELGHTKLEGRWIGKGTIIVSWCKQKSIDIDFHIYPGGSVEGIVGNARIVGGKIKKYRGELGRFFHLHSDYVISGELDGYIVESEHIFRRSIKIFLNDTGGVMTGGLHTSGSKFGDRRTMRLTVSSITLEKIDNNLNNIVLNPL